MARAAAREELAEQGRARAPAAPAPIKAPVELIEIECEAWLPEPRSVRFNGEELYRAVLYRALIKKGRELIARGLL